MGWFTNVSDSPMAMSNISNSSSVAGSASLLKSFSEKIKWHVTQAMVPSQAPKHKQTIKWRSLGSGEHSKWILRTKAVQVDIIVDYHIVEIRAHFGFGSENLASSFLFEI